MLDLSINSRCDDAVSISRSITLIIDYFNKENRISKRSDHCNRWIVAAPVTRHQGRRRRRLRTHVAPCCGMCRTRWRMQATASPLITASYRRHPALRQVRWRPHASHWRQWRLRRSMDDTATLYSLKPTKVTRRPTSVFTSSVCFVHRPIRSKLKSLFWSCRSLNLNCGHVFLCHQPCIEFQSHCFIITFVWFLLGANELFVTVVQLQCPYL